MNTLKSNLTVTIGITTCYGGESLVQTVQSIRSAQMGEESRLIIQADRTPITADVKKRLQDLNVELYWNEVAGSQFKKLKQIIDRTASDIFIFTQDDITFETDTITEVVTEFSKNSAVTMVGVRILPHISESPVGAMLSSMVRLIDKIAFYWNSGRNYLSASGRCLAFRTSLLKKFRIPESVVNGDMYLYLENRRLKGRFERSDFSKVYIRCPERLKDHIGPSSRFQYSQEELQNYFNFDIKPEYKLPFSAILRAVMAEFFRFPITFTGYLAILTYTRFFRQNKKIVSNTMWNIDTSTKIVSGYNKLS